MSKGKNLPELFEAFRQVREEQRSKADREKAKAESRKKPAEKPEPMVHRPPGAFSPPRQYATTEVTAQEIVARYGDSESTHVIPLGHMAQVVFPVSYNALLMLIIVVVVVIFMAFFVGYQLGLRSQATAPTGPVGGVEIGKPGTSGNGGLDVHDPGSGTKVDQTKPKPSPPTTTVYWRVQILTVPNNPRRLAALQEAVNVLTRNGIKNVSKRRSGSQVVLYAGAFKKADKAQAERLMRRIRGYTVNTRKEFRDARVVRTQ